MPSERVARLVVGGALAILGRDHDAALGTEHDPLERVGEVGELDRLVASAGGGQRGLVARGSARSAPTMPGVEEASAPRSTSGASGTPRVCTSRIFSRPCWSGGLTDTRRSNRPGRSSAESSTSGRLVDGDHDHALGAGEPVHLGQDLVQGLLALVVAAEGRAPAARAADRVQLVDEDDRRSRRLGLDEQVAHAARADAHDRLDELRGGDREERHSRLAGDGPREQRLAGARRPGQQHALGDTRAQRACTSAAFRRKSTTSTSSSSASSMPATSSKVTRFSPLARSACARDRPKEPSARPRAGATGDEDEQPDQQKRRPEPEQQLLPKRRRRVGRMGVDDHMLLVQQRVQGVVVDEGGYLRLEASGGTVRGARRKFGRILEGALHGETGGVNLRDVGCLHLLDEEGVRDGRARRRLVEMRGHDPVDTEQHRQQHPERHAERQPPATVSGTAGLPGRSLDPPARRGFAVRARAAGGTRIGIRHLQECSGTGFLCFRTERYMTVSPCSHERSAGGTHSNPHRQRRGPDRRGRSAHVARPLSP